MKPALVPRTSCQKLHCSYVGHTANIPNSSHVCSLGRLRPMRSGSQPREQHLHTRPRDTQHTCMAAKHDLILENQLMLSDVVTATATGAWETMAWKTALDIALPILCLWGLLTITDWAAARARAAIEQHLAGKGDVALQDLWSKWNLLALVLLALHTPALYVLPLLMFAYTVRAALRVLDLALHEYKLSALPAAAKYLINQVSAQMVPLDNFLQLLFNVTGALFTAWFFVQLKNLIVREVLLVQAARSGRTELERIYIPLSSLATWAVVVACGLSVCSSLGIKLEPLLAVGGAGGIAAGFASQQLLTNVVSGINIFLTRPFVIGDQVKFAGGADLEGTVEQVEIMRTLLRTSGDVIVAVPNKLVAELIVFNRTRSLAAAAAAAAATVPAEAADMAAAAAAAAPQRRVLCFTIQVSRELEGQLGDIKSDVRDYLNDLTKQQLVQSGLAAAAAAEKLAEAESAAEQQEMAAAVAAPVAAAAAAVFTTASTVVAAVTGSAEAPADDHLATDCAAEEQEAAHAVLEHDAAVPEPEPLPVSITLDKLAESCITLSVRCEVLLPPAAAADAVEQQIEDALLGVSSIVREKYQGVVLWQ